VGELFSAYVSVVGTEVVFYQVAISVKLQTTNETIDLTDIYSTTDIPSGFSRTLALNQYIDMVVQHRLNEQGTHTLRIVVNYLTSKNESKVLKKFYRFNVLEPLKITCTVNEIKNLYMVQCEASNQTKQLISLEKVNGVLLNVLS
jgi:hypothetical protein